MKKPSPFCDVAASITRLYERLQHFKTCSDPRCQDRAKTAPESPSIKVTLTVEQARAVLRASSSHIARCESNGIRVIESNPLFQAERIIDAALLAIGEA